MSFATAVKTSLRKWNQFSGRAPRKEYWSFSLFVLLATLVTLIIPPVGLLVFLVLQVPHYAVMARRLHDTGRSAWMILVGLIPYVGALIILVLTATDSQVGDNKYGPHSYRPGEAPLLPAVSDWAPPPEGAAPGALWAQK